MRNQNLVKIFRAIDNLKDYDDEYDDAISSEIDDMCDKLTVKQLTDLVKYNLKDAFINTEAVLLLERAIEKIFESTAAKNIQSEIDAYFIKRYKYKQRMELGY